MKQVHALFCRLVLDSFFLYFQFSGCKGTHFFDIQSHVANNCQIIGIQPPESQDSSGHITIIF